MLTLLIAVIWAGCLAVARPYCVRAYARHNAARDAERFATDTRDRFRTVFHRQQFLEQGGVLVGIAVALWLPVWWISPLATALLIVSWSALNGADFNRHFTPALNLARDKPEFYVSTTAHAAAFDRWICRMASRANVEPEKMMASVLRVSYQLTAGLAGAVLIITVVWKAVSVL